MRNKEGGINKLPSSSGDKRLNYVSTEEEIEIIEE